MIVFKGPTLFRPLGNGRYPITEGLPGEGAVVVAAWVCRQLVQCRATLTTGALALPALAANDLCSFPSETR